MILANGVLKDGRVAEVQLLICGGGRLGVRPQDSEIYDEEW